MLRASICVLWEVSHCHIDHAGAIPELMRAYPGLLVVMHEQEAPYCSGAPHFVLAGILVMYWPKVCSACVCLSFSVAGPHHACCKRLM